MTAPNLAEIRKQMTDYRSELEGLSEKLVGLRAKTDRSENERTEMFQVIDNITATDTLYRMAQRDAEDDLARAAGFGPGAANGPQGQQIDTRSAGQKFIETDGYAEFAERGARGTFESSEVRTLLGSAGGLNDGTSWLGTSAGPGLFAPFGSPVLPPPVVYRQRLFIRDVLGNVQTTLANIPYIRELNSQAHFIASGAQFVAEGTQKPEVGMEWTPDDAPIRKLAAWIPVTNEILADAPLLRGLIDERLRFSLRIAEEYAILNGNGTAPNLKGLLSATGIQTQSATAGDSFATIGHAMGKIEAVNGVASFVAMNPVDYWNAQVTRFGTFFSGQGPNAGSNNAPFGSPPAEVWGVPVVRANSVAAGTALVGCREAATVVDREQAVIRVGDQHLDYFTTNKVAILIEERLGLMIQRPNWLVNCTL